MTETQCGPIFRPLSSEHGIWNEDGIILTRVIKGIHLFLEKWHLGQTCCTGNSVCPPFWVAVYLPGRWHQLQDRSGHFYATSTPLSTDFLACQGMCFVLPFTANILEYTVSWLPIELNWPQAIILFPCPIQKREYRTKIRDTTWRSISKYHTVTRQQASIYLYYLIATGSRIFSPRVFPRTYLPISQNPSTQITFWTHWFHLIIFSLTLICAIYHRIITIVLFLWSWPLYLKMKYAKRKKKWITSQMNSYS